MIGPINLDKKQSGERSAGKPHAAFDEAGAGNVMMVAGLRPMTKVMDKPPEPKVRAPVLDPTRIAFNPQDERFEVTTPIIEKDKAWIPDIVPIMQGEISLLKLIRHYKFSMSPLLS